MKSTTWRRLNMPLGAILASLMIFTPLLAAPRGGGGGSRAGGGMGGGGSARMGSAAGSSRSGGFSGGGGNRGGISGGFSGGGNRGGISTGGISRSVSPGPAVRSGPGNLGGGGISAPGARNISPGISNRVGGGARNNPLPSLGSGGAANLGQRNLSSPGANAAVRSSIGGNRVGTVGASALGNGTVTTRRIGVNSSGRGDVTTASFVRNNFGSVANVGQLSGARPVSGARSLSGGPNLSRGSNANLVSSNFSYHNHHGLNRGGGVYNHANHNHNNNYHNHWGHYHGGYGHYPYRYGYGYRPFPVFPLLGLGWGFGLGGYGSAFGYGGYGGYGYGDYGYSAASTYYDYSAVPLVANTVQSVDPSSVAAEPPAEALDFAGQGESDFQAGKYAEAARAFRHALVDDPTNGAYIMLLSQALFASGQYDESAGAVQQAAQLLPQEKWGTVIANYKELYTNIGDYTPQLRALEKARDEKPDDPALRFLLGWHYGYLGYPKQAVRELNKTLELAPKDEVAKKMRDAMAEKLPKSEVPAAPPPVKPAPPDVKGTET
ncbi:MAG: tetratricopeptide repeat protein [Pirellulaceae bacterium]